MQGGWQRKGQTLAVDPTANAHAVIPVHPVGDYSIQLSLNISRLN